MASILRLTFVTPDLSTIIETFLVQSLTVASDWQSACWNGRMVFTNRAQAAPSTVGYVRIPGNQFRQVFTSTFSTDGGPLGIANVLGMAWDGKHLLHHLNPVASTASNLYMKFSPDQYEVINYGQVSQPPNDGLALEGDFDWMMGAEDKNDIPTRWNNILSLEGGALLPTVQRHTLKPNLTPVFLQSSSFTLTAGIVRRRLRHNGKVLAVLQDTGSGWDLKMFNFRQSNSDPLGSISDTPANYTDICDVEWFGDKWGVFWNETT